MTANACKAQTYKNELAHHETEYHEEPDMGDWDEEEESSEQ
jgi:hypothetical protein